MNNEIILYQSDELPERIEVRIDESMETVWLTQQQMADLFGRTRVAITQHIGSIFKEGELDESQVCKDFLHTTQHGAIEGKTQKRSVKYYNLDVIISVGYRVKSKQGTQFRIWATNVLRDYLLKGYVLNQRMNRIENTVENLASRINEIDFQIKSSELPTQGVFFDNQVFDAYELASKIIRSAKKQIVLIDNYINENTFTHLSKKKKGVKCIIFTKNPSNRIRLDLAKANEQYGDFEIKEFDKSHDRFLILDDETVYHLGASLKDLGKRWFAFTQLNKESVESILKEINK